MTKKILFIGRSIAHIAYYEKLLLELSKQSELTVIFDKHWSDYWGKYEYFDKFKKENSNIKFNWIPEINSFKKSYLSRLIELRSLISYHLRKDKNIFYQNRWQRYVSKKILGLIENKITNKIIINKIFALILDVLIKLWPNDKKIKIFLKNKNFDTLIITPGNMRYSSEILFLKSNIKNKYVYTLSWDNLSTKGYFSIKPNKIFVWNDMHELYAKKIHGFKKENIKKFGSLFFEKWHEKECEYNNLEGNIDIKKLNDFKKNKKFILYLGSSKNVAKDESFVVNNILTTLLRNKKDYKLVIRPHPANPDPFKKFIGNKDILVLDEKLPELNHDIIFLKYLISSSFGIVGINTSAMLEVMLLGRYCNTILIEKYTNTQENAHHFKFYQELDGLIMNKSYNEILKNIEKFKNISLTNRKKTNEKIGLFNKKASDAITEYILSF